MNKTVKIILIILAVIFIPVYLFYAIGFGLQLAGFADAVSKEGFRGALTSPQSTDLDYYASVTWLIVMIISIYIIPLILIIWALVYLIRRKRKKYIS